MGVESKYLAVVGIKKHYGWIRGYEDKLDPSYLNEDIENYENIVFKNYFPEDWVCISDEMGAQYSILGKVVGEALALEYIPNLSVKKTDFDKWTQEVKSQCEFLNLKNFDENEIGLYSFVYFY